MIEIKTDTKGNLTKESEDKLEACLKAACRKHPDRIGCQESTVNWTKTGTVFTAETGQDGHSCTVTAHTSETDDPCTYIFGHLTVSADGAADGTFTWKPTPLEEYTIGNIGTEPKAEKPSGMTFQDAEDHVNKLFDDLFSAPDWKRQSISSAADLDIAEVDINYMLEDTTARAMRQLGIDRFTAEVDGRKYTVSVSDSGFLIKVETVENGITKTSDFFDIDMGLQFALCRAVLEKAEPLQ